MIVNGQNEMTAEWFTALLGEAGVLSHGSVEHVELEAFGAGVMTSMVQARLTYADAGDGPASVLVKYPSHDEGNRGIAQLMGLYELEVRFYRDIAPRLNASSIPRCFFADVDEATGRFTLVLEDLSAHTRPGTMLSTISPSECAAALRELANFQSPLWNAPALSEISWLSDPRRTLAIFDAIPAGLKPFLARFGNALEAEHVQMCEAVLPLAGQWVRSWRGAKVLQHGEFRSGNILLGTTAGVPAVTMIDFQTVRIGPPGIDPAYFMGASLPIDERRKTERELIAGYHRDLVSAGVEDFDWNACWASYCQGALYGIYLYVGMAGQVEPSERNDRVILDTFRRMATMAVDLDSARLAGLS